NLSIHSTGIGDWFSEFWRAEVSQLFQNRQIENVLTDRDADTRRTLYRLKDSKGQILDGKMRIASNVDKRFKRRHSLNKLQDVWLRRQFKSYGSTWRAMR